MHIVVISLFPDIVHNYLKYGIIRKALAQHALKVDTLNIRDFAENSPVDDRVCGGGPGMVLCAPPILRAVQYARTHLVEHTTTVVYFSPTGIPLTQKFFENNTTITSLIFLCGRYEGIDQRVINLCVDLEISVGEYILSGGEIPACLCLEGFARLLPGVLNNPISAISETKPELCDYPVYTHPHIVKGKPIPSYLFSGHHKNIHQNRMNFARKKTEIMKDIIDQSGDYDIMRLIRLFRQFSDNE